MMEVDSIMARLFVAPCLCRMRFVVCMKEFKHVLGVSIVQEFSLMS